MNSKKGQSKKGRRGQGSRTSWDPVADWYDGWVGKHGSRYHQQVAIPSLLALLEPQPDEQILDIGAGQGVLAPHVVEAGAHYTGVDVSRKLLQRARHYHKQGRFLFGDARSLEKVEGLEPDAFDAAVFLLSIQDMDPLQPVLASAAWALRPGGRLVILMTHPAFRIPRQSGWGWDEKRKLRYRRVDTYLTPLPVPMKSHGGDQGVTRSYHRPLHVYVNGLAASGLLVNQLQEIPAHDVMGAGSRSKAEKRANEEIPLFLGIRAVKVQDEE